MRINNHTIESSGQPLEKAKKVLVTLHGRGGSAQSFITLSDELEINRNDFSILALQAIGNAWYPHSFLMPLQQNEPQLSRSLSGLSGLMEHLEIFNIKTSDVYFLGFSQGACFTLEFCARNAKRYGGIIAFTGGLLGEQVSLERYNGNFEGTPVFIGASDYDPHVPESRINESEEILTKLGAKVLKKIYANMGHTINNDELLEASRILGNYL